jgi:hypothetical protein
MAVTSSPARDELDELALTMFRNLLDASKCRFQIISHNELTAEIISQVERDQPKAVCIASLPPKGLTHTRYLCKRLRGQFPELTILAGCWGLEQNFSQTRGRLLAAGANQVGSSLLETRAQIVPLIQLQSHIQESQDRVATTGSAGG